jgi:hypothetical protein
MPHNYLCLTQPGNESVPLAASIYFFSFTLAVDTTTVM